MSSKRELQKLWFVVNLLALITGYDGHISKNPTAHEMGLDSSLVCYHYCFLGWMSVITFYKQNATKQ